MTPQEFIVKWRNAALKERSGSQEHFIDLCRLLDEPTPAEGDPSGNSYCFERGARKDAGGAGWADVWKLHHFAWEYKGQHADLDVAFNQLRQYALALENPPLLIVSDMLRFRMHTNWTNSVSQVHEIELEELADASVREKLKWAMSDPERLRPGESRQSLTERAATTFASLAQELRDRGHNPQETAHFVNRIVFCMFAEDVGLLPNEMFTRMLQQARKRPSEFKGLASKLFGVMAVGGWLGIEPVEWFNGGLFNDDTALSLTGSEIALVQEAASLDWSEIDPSILGTLFERGLDPQKRAQLGAHYTDRDKIMQIIEPVVLSPWRKEWGIAKAEVIAFLERSSKAKSRSARTRLRGQAEAKLSEFLARLRSFKILDPACGSGNFLYMALHALKDLEHQTQLEAEGLGFQRGFPGTGPSNVKGIEINPYAAELARVSVWIGEIQWMRRNGFNASRDPILKPLETIECGDALIAEDGTEAEWSVADVVIGNPPFLGGSLLRANLGDVYANRLQEFFSTRISGDSDLVCYWFEKSARLLFSGRILRVGLVATNSIRGGRNRKVLDQIVEQGVVFNAWSDEPWVLEGAAVRVSLICFAREEEGNTIKLNGDFASKIQADLTLGDLNLAKALQLKNNVHIAFKGDERGGPFDVPGSLARLWLQMPENPNGRTNADVLKPWINGKDLMGRPADKWIIDFGSSIGETEAALYEGPFGHVQAHVMPKRQMNRIRMLREHWWRHRLPSHGCRRALKGLTRFISTVRHSKHRLFVWCDTRVCPDSALIAIARDDDTTFGILHSRFHEVWALRMGTWLGKGNDPRYTPTTTFQTFPFPKGLEPNVPVYQFASDPSAIEIANSARKLVELRDRWLNPPEWVEWVDEPVAGFPPRPVPRNEDAAKALKTRTLTKLYNESPQWLAHAHANLDSAVAAAYGWSEKITEEDALAALLALNLEQSSLESK